MTYHRNKYLFAIVTETDADTNKTLTRPYNSVFFPAFDKELSDNPSTLL